MKAFLRWLGRVAATVISVVLIIVLLPYASRWAASVLPDLSAAAVTASVTLSHELKSSARLETAVIDDEGVLTSTTDAMFIGQVQSVTIQYTYHASLGIDLSKVNIKTDGSTVTLLLPEIEILSDSLTPNTIVRDDFWYPLTDERRQQLLDDELLACRAKYLEKYAASDEAWQSVLTTLESTVSAWLGQAAPSVSLCYLRAADQ